MNSKEVIMPLEHELKPRPSGRGGVTNGTTKTVPQEIFARIEKGIEEDTQNNGGQAPYAIFDNREPQVFNNPPNIVSRIFPPNTIELVVGSNFIIKTTTGQKILPYGQALSIQREIARLFKEDGIKIATRDTRPSLKKIIEDENGIEISSQMPPREYQEKVVNALYNKPAGVVWSPTGSGKTNMIAYVIGKINTTTLVIVPSSSLVEQTKTRFCEIFKNINPEMIGAITGAVSDKTKEIKPITITTWQSLQNKDTLNAIAEYGFNTLFVDECHHSSADVLQSIVNTLNVRKKFGVSATPYRSNQEDEQKIYASLGPVVERVEIEELYNTGALIRPRIVFVRTGEVSVDSCVRMNFVETRFKDPQKRIQTFCKMAYLYANQSHDSQIVVKDIQNFAERIGAEKFFTILQAIAAGEEFSSQIYNEEERKTIGFCRRVINHLCRGNAFGEKMKASLNGKEKSHNDFAQALGWLKKSADNDPYRRRKIIDTVKETITMTQGDDRSLILSNTVDLAQWACEEIKEIRDNVSFVSGKSKKKEDFIADLAAAKEGDSFIVASTISLLQEGTDIPPLKRVYILSPSGRPFSAIYTKEQIIGRAIRPHSATNKKTAEVIFFTARMSDFRDFEGDLIDRINRNLGVQPEIYESPEEFIEHERKMLFGTGLSQKEKKEEKEEKAEFFSEFSPLPSEKKRHKMKQANLF